MMRPKHRYLLVEPAAHVGREALQAELLRVIGTDYHSVNPKILDVRGRMVIRCSLAGMGRLIVALALIKSINGADNAFYTLKASGTIRALMSGQPTAASART